MLRYPKPGTPNPLVSVHIFSLATYAETGSLPRAKQELSWDAALPLADRIIAEVAWVGDDALLVKETDRAARRGSVVVFQGSEKGKVVRKLGSEGEEGDDGWIDAVCPPSFQRELWLIKTGTECPADT
jgi:dipeptidyl aminopeptidase